MLSLSRLGGRFWFSIFVILPTVLATLYYVIFASDIFVSESRFVIKSQSQKQAQLSTLANLIQTTGLSTGQEQANEVLDYVRSRNALADLQRITDVKGKFMSPAADRLARYPAPLKEDRFENLFKYYGKMVDARLDNDTGTAILTVKAFTGADARDLNAGLLKLSENLVNQLNNRAQRRAITEGLQRVREAQARLLNARMALRQFRNSEELIDPVKQAAGVLDVSNKLVAEQAGLQAQLQLMERTTPGNPTISALRSRIAALGGQIAAQNGRVVGTGSGIASKLGGYEKLTVEQEFATQMLTAASASLEQARSDSVKQQFYLETVVQPNNPDLALFPHRIREILTIAAALLCLYFIGWMFIVGILEHAPEE